MQFRFVRSLCLCFLLFVCFSNGAAYSEPPAQKAPPAISADSRAEVEQRLFRARELFVQEKYVEAAEETMRIYVMDAKPIYLFNAAQAYRKAGYPEEARDLYQRYVEVEPKGPLALEARGYVADMDALLKEQAERKNVVKQALAIEQALKKEQNKPWYKRPLFIGLATAAGIVIVGGGISLISVGSLGITNGGTQTAHFR